VRQELLTYLIGPFQCPPHLIRVEASLKSFVPLEKVPKRRLDIMCFAPLQNSLLPLLVIECKAKKPNLQASFQVGGYNYFLKAPYHALHWEKSIVLAMYGKIIYEGPYENMPHFPELLKKLFS
jgi:hypothetical protein